MQRRVRYARLGPLAIMAVLMSIASLVVANADEIYGRHQFEENLRGHWSFQKLARPPVPAVTDKNWVRNPIDAYVLDRLQKAGLRPAPPADRAVLVRRVYLDLIGLPPTPAELDAFLADQSPAALERVVDNLLARPQYGERWARHWLDVVRYAETNGYERDGVKPQAWRYRDWVIDALNSDMPYDRFLTEQLAGDELPDTDVAPQTATTMLRLGPWDDEPADNLADRYDQLDDIVATTSAAFTGLTLRCARCHDHKFEPLTQKDYSRWQAVFAPLKRPQRDRSELDRELGPPDQVQAYLQTVKQLNEQQAELEKQIRTLQWQVAQRATSEGRLPGPIGAPPAAATAGTGQGAVQSSAEESAKPATDASTPPGSSSLLPIAKDLPAEFLTALATEPGKRNDGHRNALGKYDGQLKELMSQLASADEQSHFAQWRATFDANKTKYPAPLVKGYVWYEEGPTFGQSHVLKRGDPRSLGDAIDPGFPAILVDSPPALPTATAHSTGRRLQLARWLASPDHPLTARVIVNRLWQHHFGEGIVASENDFGVMGAAPANQPLLDWLASELVASGWRLKQMHRMMVLSQTYQMASTADPEIERLQPQDDLHWRHKPARIEAEALRDTILAVSGQLNLKRGGPGVYPKISREVLETQSKPGDGWHPSDPAEAARRSVYVFVKRTLLVPELEVLDFPSTEETCEQRVTSTVAPQALTFLNGQFIHEQAQAFAERLTREAGTDDRARIDLAYRLAFSRLPSDAERQRVLDFLAKQQAQIAADSGDTLAPEAVRQQALSALCLVLLNTNEFAYVQ